MNMTPTPSRLDPRRRRRLLPALAAGSLVFAACGGGDDDSSAADGATIDELTDESISDVTDQIDDIDIDTDGLDEGQIEILDDVIDGLGDEFSDDADADAPAPWTDVRLVTSSGNARMEVIDETSFGGVTEVFSTPIPDSLNNVESANRTFDTGIVVGDSIWISAQTALHQVSLADGAISASIPIDEIVPGGSFGGITGDADGIFAIAAMRGGDSFVVEVDPAAGTVRNSIDTTAPAVAPFTITSNATHVAVGYDNAPGIPVKLIERATGDVTDIGSYLQLHGVHIVRDELWVVISSGTTSDPDTYEKYALDGTPLGESTLPRTGVLKTFGDRAVLVEPSNAADPDDPVAPVEIEPVGTPIEALLPAGTVLIDAYAEIDGYTYSSASCCTKDDFDFPTRLGVVDMSTGETVFAADSLTATAILPPVEL